MKEQQGRYFALSPARKLVWDILDAGMKVPLATVERRVNVSDLLDARAVAVPRPTWNSIFTKAYAKVTAVTPELRRLFIRWPWGRLYEHPQNVAVIAVEVDYRGEQVIVANSVNRPEERSLLDLDQRLFDLKKDPTKSKWFLRSMMASRLPKTLRRLLWATLDWSGGRRARVLGTFGVTSTAFAGAGIAKIITPVAHVLSYGVIEPNGDVVVSISFDHRIMDGAAPARALVLMEKVMNSEILSELRGLQAKPMLDFSAAA